ncbi:MAG TPA: hypothetical protein VE954_28805 [Oligoflexus sp.]|uniref:hypothetical protein n=1 Tax=Oligoflexus sp. TaxID=1971216 RepID=UPI002D47C107|nr:hypothetical protein [Oligoflexus sp.]HYX37121.1 hypothetical protein [Oligoflexus sp.]
MSAKLKPDHHEAADQFKAELIDDAFWGGFGSAFDFFGVFNQGSYRSNSLIQTGADIDVSFSIVVGLEIDAEALDRDIQNLTADAKSATRKVLNKDRP